MSKILHLFPFLFLSFLVSSCLLPSEKGRVSLSLSSEDQAARNSAKPSRASVSEVKLINDQIVMSGSDLDGVVKVKLSASGLDLSILSQSASELILSSSAQMALALNTILSFTLEDAYGATVVEVTFNLPDSSVSTAKIGDEQVTSAKIADGAITAVKLDQMSAAVGQLLRWNGSSWLASDLDALTYAGTWDASVGGNPNPSAVGGEYYIVSAAGVADPGDGNSRSWDQGDWIVFNDNTSTWDRISNSSDVTSFEGRTGGVTAQIGDYTWAMIDKSSSSLGDIADVDLSTPATNGKVLKFNGTSWVADDDLSGGGAGSVTSSEIADGSIVDADISTSAAIAWSKIDKSAATSSDVGLGNVTNDAQIKAADLDDTTTLGTSTTKVPSQNAVKTYVDNAVTGMGSVTSLTGGAALSDGPYTTTGTIDVQVDDTTIEVVADALQIKALGVGTSHLAANSVTNAKISSVAATKITTACSDGEVLAASSGNFVCANTTSVGNWTITSDPYLFYNGGNVGIGTATPDTSLEIVNNEFKQLKLKNIGSSSQELWMGTVADSVGSYIGNNAYYSVSYNFTPNYSSASGINFRQNGSTEFWNDTGLTSGVDYTPSKRMIISNTGNVGIGTVNPGQKLHLDGGIARFSDTGSNWLDIDGSAVRGNDVLLQSRFNAIYIDAPDYLSFQTGSTDRLRINSSGNVGIGTSTPSTALEVNGTITASGFNGPVTSTSTSVGGGSAANPSFTFSSDSDTGFYSGTGNTIEVSVGGTNIFDISTNGFVSSTSGGASVGSSIGSASTPTFSFAGDEDTGWFRAAANELAASTAGSERIRIDSTGNVGIGNVNPDNQLDITGENKVTNATVNGSVTSILALNDIDAELGAGPKISFSSGYSSDQSATPSITGARLGSSKEVGIGSSATQYKHSLVFETSSFPNGVEEKMRITSDGNVGIGTSNPSVELEVSGSTRLTSIGDAYQLVNDNHGLRRAAVTDSDGRDVEVYTDGAGSDIILSTNGKNSNEFVVKENGNVGIGTSNPTEALDIEGQLKVSGGVVKHEEFSVPGNSIRYLKVNITASYGFYEITLSGYGSSGSASMLAKWVDGGHGGNTSTHQASEISRLTQGNPILGELMKIRTGTYLKIENTHSNAISLHARVEAFNSSNVMAQTFLETVEPTGGESISYINTVSTGNVGIGVNNPVAKLHISDGGTSTLSTPETHYSHLILENTTPDSDTSESGIVFNHRFSPDPTTLTQAGGRGGRIVSGREHVYGGAISTHDSNLKFYTSENGIDNEHMRIVSSGQVGIGVESPVADLHVKDTGSSGSIMIERDPGQSSLWMTGSSYTALAATSYMTFNTNSNLDQSSPSGEAMRLTTSGNVGIGTTNPSEKLSVNGGNIGVGASSQVRFKLIGDAENERIESLSNFSIDIDSDNNTTNGSFKVTKDSGSSLFTVLESGNVGIGTTAPTRSLEVVGSIKSNYAMTGNQTGITLGTESSSRPKIEFNQSDNSRRFWLSTNDINGTDERLSIYAGPLIGSGATSEALVIKGNGNVGIGTTAPVSELHVNGGICVTSDDSCSAIPGDGEIAAETTLNTGADYAEYFYSEDNELSEGDLVELNLNSGKVRKYQRGGNLIGIVSTNPGVVGNSNLKNEDDTVLVALVGQVPFNKEQVIVKNGFSYTFDNQPLGMVLSNGHIYINLSSSDGRQNRQIATLLKENKEIKDENNEIKRELNSIKNYLCLKETNAPFCNEYK